MIWEILGLFVNPLTAYNKYSLLKRGNFLQHFQKQLSQKQKTFSLFFFFPCFKFIFNFEHFQKKRWTWELMYFWFYGLGKEGPSTSKMGNGPTHSSKLNDSTFIIFIDPVKRFRFKKSFWVIWKIFGLFLNPLTAYNKYSLLKRDNL